MNVVPFFLLRPIPYRFLLFLLAFFFYLLGRTLAPASTRTPFHWRTGCIWGMYLISLLEEVINLLFYEEKEMIQTKEWEKEQTGTRCGLNTQCLNFSNEGLRKGFQAKITSCISCAYLLVISVNWAKTCQNQTWKLEKLLVLELLK